MYLTVHICYSGFSKLGSTFDDFADVNLSEKLMWVFLARTMLAVLRFKYTDCRATSRNSENTDSMQYTVPSSEHDVMMA